MNRTSSALVSPVPTTRMRGVLVMAFIIGMPDLAGAPSSSPFRRKVLGWLGEVKALAACCRLSSRHPNLAAYSLFNGIALSWLDLRDGAGLSQASAELFLSAEPGYTDDYKTSAF
jgi:hypothetical protein